MTIIFRVIAPCLLAMFWSGAASAQRILVETVSRSSMGEATRASLHGVDLERMAGLPRSVVLPMPNPLGDIMRSSDGDAAYVISGPPWRGEEVLSLQPPAFLSVTATSTLQPATRVPTALPQGWRPTAALLLSDDALAVSSKRHSPEGQWEGRLDVYERERLGERVGSAPKATYELPGPAVAMLALPNGRVALLCDASRGLGAALHVRDVSTGAVAVETLRISAVETARWGAEPVAMASSPDGRWLYIVTSGYSDSATGDTATCVHRVDPVKYTVEGAPLVAPGAATCEPNPMTVSGDGTLWLATREPTTGFAYATHGEFQGPRPVVDVQTSFFNVDRPLRLVATPHYIAVAVDERLEVWPGRRPPGTTHAFEAPISALLALDDLLVVGEGHRLHRISPADGHVDGTLELSQGAVSRVVQLPDAVALSSDSDGDGIPDHIDHEPATPSPFLDLPPVVLLHGESVGQEIRALRVASPWMGEGGWRVDVDASRYPWLRVYPRAGRSGEAFYLGVDPALYGAHTDILEGMLTVHAEGSRAGLTASGSPATVLVQVQPPRTDEPRILWLLEGGRGDRLEAFGRLGGLERLLSAAPEGYAHRLVSGPYMGALTPYRVVVIDAPSAARGAVTRQALLDYVAEGGALLFLGRHLDEEAPRTLDRWLAPLGLSMDSGARVTGVFRTNRDHWLARHWGEFRIDDGCALRADNPERVIVPGATGSGLATLVSLPHGRGRIIAMAADTPLQSEALKRLDHRLFALDVFRWLARAGTEVEDVDGDGLPDAVEDANGNGVVDPGETDPLNPDTDGDGVPDGIEDRNRNGRVDEGETSPLNADSDGDGVPDGADVSPLPPVGAPHVEALSPSSGPAEGGTTVIVSGRHFGPGTRLLIDGIPAPGLRRYGATALSAQTPPAALASGGDVTVQVVDAHSGLQGVLPIGFRYTPRSTVSLRLAQISSTADRIVYALHLDGRRDLEVGQLTALVEVEPAGVARIVEVAPGTLSESTGRHVEKRPAPSGGAWVDVSPGRTATGMGELARITVECDSHGLDVSVALHVESARVYAPNGQSLTVETSGLQVDTPDLSR